MRSITPIPNPLTAWLASCIICVSISALARDAAFDPPKAAQHSTNVTAPVTISLPGVVLHKDKDIQGIWIAPGFNFKGYDALYVSETVFKGVVRENEELLRNAAITNVQDLFVHQFATNGLFPSVLRGAPGDAPGKNLRLVNTIIEYEKGGGGARFWLGEYGVGQPKIKVHGEMYDGEKLVFVFEVKRSGEGADAHLNGGFKSDIGIQTHDIWDMARDLSTCFTRNSTNDWK